ncbi:efflux RND transporter periplasmic adaptor subunit [Massilia cavernae]|uniref:Efflux RND transporter periplasmic adaptor subunit n=1 Tax=Massilia cavernae TaxID=2320864 RepID=A0A418XR81_9BURK|nr:efflux RND transporter periplasmic adaptor subunit [Massilia cavernae]
MRPAVTAPLGTTLAASLLLLLGACSKEAPKTEEVRPVRAIVAGSSDIDLSSEFAGEVRPRVESRLGFRVGGKITARKVDVGATVKRGQVLMQLDPQDLQLTRAQAAASLRAAETQRDLARADLKRFEELRATNFVSQATLDARRTAFTAAQANVEAARAGFSAQSNQAGYTTLTSDIDGVVTLVSAEVGQVVAPGTPVVQVANPNEKEVVIALPEDKVDAMRKVGNVTVRLWSNPDLALQGKIREVSPVADPATRTYQVRVAIPGAGPEVRLGMTARVQFASKAGTQQIRLPLTALFHDKSSSAVWVVDKGAVKLVPVQVGGTTGNEIVVAGGLQPGQTVVTAGVHLLKNGQKVRILGADAPVAGAAPAGGAAK